MDVEMIRRKHFMISQRDIISGNQERSPNLEAAICRLSTPGTFTMNPWSSAKRLICIRRWVFAWTCTLQASRRLLPSRRGISASCRLILASNASAITRYSMIDEEMVYLNKSLRKARGPSQTPAPWGEVKLISN